MKILVAALARLSSVIAVTAVQTILGVTLGVVVVFAFWMFRDRPSGWQCNTKQEKTVELANIHFHVQAEECVAENHRIQTKTTVSASHLGEEAVTKIFEYRVFRGGDAGLKIEEVDGHTVRIVMPASDEAGHEIADARYMGVRTWENVTFVYGRHNLK